MERLHPMMKHGNSIEVYNNQEYYKGFFSYIRPNFLSRYYLAIHYMAIFRVFMFESLYLRHGYIAYSTQSRFNYLFLYSIFVMPPTEIYKNHLDNSNKLLCHQQQRFHSILRGVKSKAFKLEIILEVGDAQLPENGL